VRPWNKVGFLLLGVYTAGFSLAYGRSSSTDNYVSRHKDTDEVTAADVTRWPDTDRGRLQQLSASVVNGNGALGRSQRLTHQMTEANARSTGNYFHC